MRVIKGTLSVDTKYVENNFEIEVDDNVTEYEIIDEIEQLWNDFRDNEINGGWDIESDEIINE